MSCPPLRLTFTALLTLALAGCGVAQNRTITFSADGKQAAVEHGRDGIFIVEEDGSLTKIFQPGPDVLVASTPLWSPTDKRLIFITAEPVKKPDRPPAPHDPDPAGDLYFPESVVYTCWLRDAPRDGGSPEPRPLFTALCDHPAYVASNLAVRWRPDGRAILYVRQTGEHRHELFAYNLETQTSELVFSHPGESLVFDWAPDKARLWCILGSSQKNQPDSGMWVGVPGADDWWRVPESNALAQAGLGTDCPAWTNDGQRFAFVTGRETGPKQPMEYTLHIGDAASRTVQTAAVGPRCYRDLHWAPDGGRLGVVIDPPTDDRSITAFLAAEQGGSLRLFADGRLSDPITPRPVRSFAGWDSTGSRLACVVPELSPYADGAAWAFLFLTDAQGRDALLIRDKDDAPHEVFSGMRLTFPHWSPTETKLSLWATFTPPYRSAADPFGRNLRPGDPAAIYDAATGAMNWKAVNAHERIQVGNYYLLKRDYAEAWRWYEQADKGDAANAVAMTAGPRQAWQGFREVESTLLLQSYCLSKLGRSGEAAAMREQGERLSLPAAPADLSDLATAPLHDQARRRLDEKGVDARLFRDLLAAEAFLSVDAAEDGEAYFRDGLRDAAGGEDRLSKALALGQMLLMRGRWEEYADLTTDTAAPLLLRLIKRDDFSRPVLDLPTLSSAGAMALLPLFAPDFLGKLTEEQTRTLESRWRALREQADGDDKRLAVDLVLRAANHRLGRAQEENEAADRVNANPARARWLGDRDVADWIQIRRAISLMASRLGNLIGRAN